jgi:hypothetical protein
MHDRGVTHWRSRLVHPWRHLRRWFVGTPDRDIAVTFLGVGCLALLSAALLWYLTRTM